MLQVILYIIYKCDTTWLGWGAHMLLTCTIEFIKLHVYHVIYCCIVIYQRQYIDTFICRIVATLIQIEIILLFFLSIYLWCAGFLDHETLPCVKNNQKGRLQYSN